jgi:hypothetical protein
VSKRLLYEKKPNQHKYMNANVGTIDRTLRILAGLGLIAYGIVNQSWVGAIGLVPLLTGLVRFCPVYCPLGINTAGKSGGGDGGSCGCGGGKCG